MKRLSLLVLVNIFLVIAFTPLIKAENLETDLYKVGVNDALGISVLDHDELKSLVTVAADGTITFPYLGTVFVKNMTLAEIKKEITERLQAGYVKYPVVTVALMQSMSRMFFVYGQFNANGQVKYEDDMTLIMALSVIGGARAEGLFGKLTVMRKQDNSSEYKEILETRLNNGFLLSRKLENFFVKADDILLLERSKTFLIQGEVSKRGRFELEKDMTVLRALLEAGGTTEGGRYGVIKVRRKQEGASGEYRDIAESGLSDGVIESREVEDTFLQPDDILIVERSKGFLIQGEVSRRGRFELEKDMTVIRALLEAGGTTEDGRYGVIKVRRMQEGASGEYRDIAESGLSDGVIESREVEDTFLQPDDILIVERSKTFLIQGEISRRGRFILEKDMTVLRALLEAGGVTEGGRYGKIKLRRKREGADGEYIDIVEAWIADGVIESREVEDTLLQPDDILIVESEKTYFIYGEANRVGEFILKNDMTVFKALIIGGGFTKWGSESRVKVLRHTENSAQFETIKINVKDIIKGDATADIFLKPGDTIVVSKGIF